MAKNTPRRHYVDRAHQFGMHTFAAVIFDDDLDSSVFRCTGCGARVFGYMLNDPEPLWQLEAGSTCPDFAIAMTERTNHGHEADDREHRRRGGTITESIDAKVRMRYELNAAIKAERVELAQALRMRSAVRGRKPRKRSAGSGDSATGSDSSSTSS